MTTKPIEMKQNNVPTEEGWYFFCNQTYMRSAFGSTCTPTIPVRVWKHYITSEWFMTGVLTSQHVDTISLGNNELPFCDKELLWSNKLTLEFPSEFERLTEYQ